MHNMLTTIGYSYYEAFIYFICLFCNYVTQSSCIYVSVHRLGGFIRMHHIFLLPTNAFTSVCMVLVGNIIHNFV